MILGLETSCDETSAAVLDGGRIRSNVVSSQAELHARFGGVVPEVASRRHLELVSYVVRDALEEADASLDDVDLLAVTAGPGLIGALLVGVAAAKGIAFGRRLPLAPVDHLHGHVAALFLEPEPLEPPFLCLLASGGHTLLLDVQEEGLAPGYRLKLNSYDLGVDIELNDAVQRLRFEHPAVRDLPPEELERRRADLAASYQRAIVRALVGRTLEAAEAVGAETIAVVGGVAANSELRGALLRAALAPLPLCTDNAAMIASAARFVEALPYPQYLELDAHP